MPLDEGGDAVGLFEGHVEARLPDDGLAVGRQEDGAGREHFAVAVGQRDRLAVVVERGHGAEGGSQIDADHLARAVRHVVSLWESRPLSGSVSVWVGRVRGAKQGRARGRLALAWRCGLARLPSNRDTTP